MSTSLVSRLPVVRGRYVENAALGDTTWFRTGGRAEVLYKPADFEDLANFLKGTSMDIPITVLGVCSNVIIRDGGIKGVTIKLGGAFADDLEKVRELRGQRRFDPAPGRHPRH